jgi:lipopolysaccharide export system permease protein
MRRLDRYLFHELLTPLAFCLIGIQSLVIFFTVISDGKIQEAKLHFFEAIEYGAAASMEYLTIIFPISLLLALLMSLTHHARHNEITAMRAAGISLWRICLPYFIVGLVMSALLFFLNEKVVPRCLARADHLVHRDNDVAAKGPTKLDFANEQAHRKWMIADYHAATGEMRGVEVVETMNGIDSHLYASRAVRTNGVWMFYDVNEVRNGAPYLSTNVLAMPEFDETLEEINAEVKIGRYLSPDTVHDPNIPLHEIFLYLRWHPNLPRTDSGRLLTDMQERFSMPLTCLVVAFIAIPFGAAPGRRNLFFGVAGSIFICFAYFVLQRVCLAFGSSGTWPPWLAAWLPNFFFGALGLILTARIR